ncbi:MAG TPA: hypothetical protein VGM01_00760 [Ktedonobacteraceae bacterium]
MRKKTIAILFGLGFGIVIIATFFYIGGIAAMASASASCDSSLYATCSSTGESGGLALLLVGGLLYLGGAVLSTIAWVAILIKQAQRQQWAWFVCTLLFNSICMLIWLIVEPEVPRVQYVPVYQPIQAGYAPVYPTDGPYSSTSYPSNQERPYYQDPYRPQE